MKELQKKAHKALTNGYLPAPVKSGTKAPEYFGGSQAKHTRETALQAFQGGSGIGLLLDGLVAIDYDIDPDILALHYPPEHAEKIRAILYAPIDKHRPLLSQGIAKRGKKGFTIILRGKITTELLHLTSMLNPTIDGKEKSTMETYDLLSVSKTGTLNFTVMPLTIHPETKKPYVYLGKKTIENTPLDALPFITDDLILDIKAAQEMADNYIREVTGTQHQTPPEPKKPRVPYVGNSPIEAWNQAHDIRATLEQYGYARRGKEYVSPHSTTAKTGGGAVNIFDDSNKCFIHSGSDPLNGTRSPFDFYRHYEHGGNYKAAVREAAQVLGIGHNKSDVLTAFENESQKDTTPKPLPIDTAINLESGTVITQADIAQNRHAYNGKKCTLLGFKAIINTSSNDYDKWRIVSDCGPIWAIDGTLPSYNALPDKPTQIISKNDVRQKMIEILQLDEQVQVVSMPGGSGKTAALPDYANLLNDNERILVLAPTIELAMQIQDDMTDSIGLYDNCVLTGVMDVSILMGRERDINGKEYKESGNDPICQRAPLFEALRNENIPQRTISGLLCRSKDNVCPHYENCHYIKQRHKASKSKIVISTHEMALIGAISGDFKHVISDEMPNMISTPKINKSSFDAYFGETAKEVDACYYALSEGTLLNELPNAVEISEKLKAWLKEAREQSITTEVKANLDDMELSKIIKSGLKCSKNKTPPIALAVATALIEALKKESNKIYPVLIGKNKEPALGISKLRRFNFSKNPKITIMDATARKIITSGIWPESHYHKIGLSDAVGCRVIQDTSCKFTQSDLTKSGTIGQLALLQKATNASIITQKAASEALQSLGVPKHKTGHYNALRGINRFSEEDVLIMAGRTLIPAHSAEEQARAIWDDVQIDGKWQLQRCNISEKKVTIESHSDSRVAAIIASKRDDELTQTAVRLRTVHGKAGRTLIILGNTPVPEFTPNQTEDVLLPSIGLGKCAQAFWKVSNCDVLPLSRKAVSVQVGVSVETVKKWKLSKSAKDWLKGVKPLLVYLNREVTPFSFKESTQKFWSESLLITPTPEPTILEALSALTGFDEINVKDLPTNTPNLN